MNKIILFLIILSSQTALAVNKQLAIQYSQITSSYASKLKSVTPDKGVVFISSRVDPDYMDVKEVNLTINPTQVIFERVVSSKRKNITECNSETNQGVSVVGSQIIISTTRLPVRIICFGDSQNYREVYSTFKE
jgi:hypothetical protein